MIEGLGPIRISRRTRCKLSLIPSRMLKSNDRSLIWCPTTNRIALSQDPKALIRMA